MRQPGQLHVPRDVEGHLAEVARVEIDQQLFAFVFDKLRLEDAEVAQVPAQALQLVSQRRVHGNRFEAHAHTRRTRQLQDLAGRPAVQQQAAAVDEAGDRIYAPCGGGQQLLHHGQVHVFHVRGHFAGVAAGDVLPPDGLELRQVAGVAAFGLRSEKGLGARLDDAGGDGLHDLGQFVLGLRIPGPRGVYADGTCRAMQFPLVQYRAQHGRWGRIEVVVGAQLLAIKGQQPCQFVAGGVEHVLAPLLAHAQQPVEHSLGPCTESGAGLDLRDGIGPACGCQAVGRCQDHRHSPLRQASGGSQGSVVFGHQQKGGGICGVHLWRGWVGGRMILKGALQSLALGAVTQFTDC